MSSPEPPLVDEKHGPLVLSQEPHAADNEKQPAARTITGVRWVLVLLAILSAQFLFALGNTIVANVQPVIVAEFDAILKLPWISVAFFIGAAGTNLIWGKVYDQFSSKWTYILCMVIFEAGSALCGAASTMDAFIVGRAICGFSGSGMYVGLMAMIAATTTIQERPVYLGLTGLVWGLGTVLGPIIGGAFTDSSAGWRWSFYINLIIGGIFAPVYLFMLPNSDPLPGVSLAERARAMDYLGAILTAGTFVSGVMALSFGGVEYPWGSGIIIGLFCCSAVLFILLGVQQTRTILTTTTRRVFPVEFFGSRTMLVLFGAMASGGTAIFLPVYFIPLLFQFTRGDSALESGVRLLPFIMLLILSVVLSGALLSRFGFYMPWYLAGGILVVIGGSLMYTVTGTTPATNVYGNTICIGFGVGLFAQASFAVAQAVTTPSMIGSAIGFISCAQITGITLSLAIANALFLNKAQQGIQKLMPDIALHEVQHMIAGAKSERFLSLDPAMRDRVLNVIVTAQSMTYVLVITTGALVVVLSLLMKRESLFIAAAAPGGA